MATTTLGVKVDETLRQRLKAAADKLGCTPHWLHKQALLSYIDAIEHGRLPDDISHLTVGEAEGPDQETAVPASAAPFHQFVHDVQPQSVLRAAITSAYRRPETECVPMLLDKARCADTRKTHDLARRLVQTLRGKRKSGGVEGLI